MSEAPAALRAQTFKGIIDGMPQGMILCDCSSRLVYANRAAAAVLAAGDGIRLERGVVIAKAGDAGALRAAIGQACHRTEPGRACLFIHRSSRPPAILSVAPVGEEGEQRLALLLLQTAARLDDAYVDPLKELFGLSPTEALVALRIASGCSIAEIAQERDVAVATVRAQVKSLGAKLGCGRQTEIAVVIGSLCSTGVIRANMDR